MDTRAASKVDLSSIPLWALVVAAALGCACVLAASLRIMPRSRRPTIVRNNLLPGFALFVVASFFSRQTLWYCTVSMIPLSALVVAVGKLPDDLPPWNDPAYRLHPWYRANRRRGRVIGALTLMTILAVVALSAIFVK